MPTPLRDLPKFLVLEPESTVHLEMHLETPACEIDVELTNAKAGRSFVLLIGPPGGPYVQRVRLSGRARIHFDPQSPGDYTLLLANPNTDPLVLRLRARDLGPVRRRPVATGRKGAGPSRRRRTARHPTHPPRASSSSGWDP